jgi:glucokinase
MVYYLCGDVGGTNSRLQLFELCGDGSTKIIDKQVLDLYKFLNQSNK